MKLALVILASFCLLAQAVQQLPSQVADKTYLVRQRNIYELFWHVDQPTVYHPELYQKARTFNILENVANYNDQVAKTRIDSQSWSFELYFILYILLILKFTKYMFPINQILIIKFTNLISTNVTYWVTFTNLISIV